LVSRALSHMVGYHVDTIPALGSASLFIKQGTANMGLFIAMVDAVAQPVILRVSAALSP
jgi:hypothetical protein